MGSIPQPQQNVPSAMFGPAESDRENDLQPNQKAKRKKPKQTSKTHTFTLLKNEIPKRFSCTKSKRRREGGKDGQRPADLQLLGCAGTKTGGPEAARTAAHGDFSSPAARLVGANGFHGGAPIREVVGSLLGAGSSRESVAGGHKSSRFLQAGTPPAGLCDVAAEAGGSQLAETRPRLQLEGGGAELDRGELQAGPPSGPSVPAGGSGGTKISSVGQNYCQSCLIPWSTCRTFPASPPRPRHLAAE